MEGKSNDNSMREAQSEELTAMVKEHPALRRKSLEFDRLMGQEVTIDPDSAATFTVDNTPRLRVRVTHRKNPSISSFIAANFLEPLCKKTEDFLSLK